MSKLEISQVMGRGKVLQQEDSLGEGLVTQEPWVGKSDTNHEGPWKSSWGVWIFSTVQWETIEEFKSEEQEAHLRKKCLVPHTETEIQRLVYKC